MIEYVKGIWFPLNVNAVPMDEGVHGSHCGNEDGSYSVFLNCRDCEERQREAFMHEVDHIRGEHLSMHDAGAAETAVRR